MFSLGGGGGCVKNALNKFVEPYKTLHKNNFPLGWGVKLDHIGGRWVPWPLGPIPNKQQQCPVSILASSKLHPKKNFKQLSALATKEWMSLHFPRFLYLLWRRVNTENISLSFDPFPHRITQLLFLSQKQTFPEQTMVTIGQPKTIGFSKGCIIQFGLHPLGNPYKSLEGKNPLSFQIMSLLNWI